MTQHNSTSKFTFRCLAYSAAMVAAFVPASVSYSAEAPQASSPFSRLVDPGGCVIEQITTADHEEYQVQSVSADGGLLSMTARRQGAEGSDPVERVYEMNLATGERTALTPSLTNSGPYSPDGKFNVMALATDNGKTDIFEYERATGELRPVTSHDDWDWLPSYSPDGRFIVFNSYRVNGQSDIFLFEKSTGALQRLTDDPRYEAHAQFSNDGNRILYHRMQGKRDEGGYDFDLFVHDMKTGKKTQLTDAEYEEGYPAWAPDGRHIVYSSDMAGKQGKPNLYVLAPDGEIASRLTEGDWKDSYAVWTKDGSFIYFNSDRAGVGNIYRIPMEGLECQGG